MSLLSEPVIALAPSPKRADAKIQPKERRLVYRLRNYLESLRHDRPYPALGDIDPAAIPDIWPWCFVIDVGCKGPLPEFQYMGPHFAVYSRLFVGSERDNIADSTMLDKATERWSEVMEQAKPIIVEEEITRFDRRRLLFRSAMFPLSDDQIHINFVIGAANGKLLEASS